MKPVPDDEKEREAAVEALSGMSIFDRTLLSDIRKARAGQPEHQRHRFCRICGPFMMDSCPAAPAHDLRPDERKGAPE